MTRQLWTIMLLYKYFENPRKWVSNNLGGEYHLKVLCYGNSSRLQNADFSAEISTLKKLCVPNEFSST